MKMWRLFWVLNYPAGWGVGASSTWDRQSAEANDTRLYSTLSVAVQQSRSKRYRLCCAEYSARPCFQKNTSRTWWKCCSSASRRSETVLISEWLTLLSGNGTGAYAAADRGHFRHALWTCAEMQLIDIQERNKAFIRSSHYIFLILNFSKVSQHSKYALAVSTTDA